MDVYFYTERNYNVNNVEIIDQKLAVYMYSSATYIYALLTGYKIVSIIPVYAV